MSELRTERGASRHVNCLCVSESETTAGPLSGKIKDTSINAYQDMS